MASVKSLGLHQPSGLQHAVDEQLLPANPSSTAYTWDILTDETGDGSVEDELLTTKNCVIWCRGGVFRKSYKFDLEKESIVQALLANFPASEDDRTRHHSEQSGSSQTLEKALIVFLKTQAHIYFLSGTSHVVHMPFEVESACAGPIGVIIQRKQKAGSDAPIDWKFPRVPPNSFVSSQLTTFNSSQQSTFSFTSPRKGKGLKLGLGSTLENMWDAQMEQSDSHWPRLVSLIDPLLEIGLVVTDVEKGTQARTTANKPSPKPAFLRSGEELLHIENVDLPGAESLILAVTMHQDASTYTIWRLSYLSHQDPFVSRGRKAKSKASKRRSSMAPGLASGAATPVHPNHRESFGAPLPGKRQRKPEKEDKPIDLMSTLEQQDKADAGVTRRSSRRVSSMLARADLSVSYERSVFADQSHIQGHATSKRHDSLGGHARLSASHQQIHPSLGSLLEAPLDAGLDEGLLHMGLDDHDFDGLQQEVMFTKVHTFRMESSNVRHSVLDPPASERSKVFVLTAPPFASNERSRGQLLVAIQDPADRRLQLITLHLRLQQKFDLPTRATKKDPSSVATVSVVPGDLRKAQNVVDSCKLVDGEKSAILILSESMDGHHELSTQAPWSELTKVSLSLLFAENTRGLTYRGREVDRDVKQRKSEVIDFRKGSISGIRYPRRHGVVDVKDDEGRLHQLRIQLEPKSPQVRKALAACSSILSDCHGERFHAGWLHIMQWLLSRDDTGTEWSGFTILLLATFLNLGRNESTTFPATRLTVRHRRPASGSFGSIKESDDWKALETGETPNSLFCPPWMMNSGWEWALDEDLDEVLSSQGDHISSAKFIPRHIGLAKEFMSSPAGQAALGQEGFMPISLGKSVEARRKVAVDVFMALHLLLEEQKLDITTPEYTSPGRADLRVILCQIARWLRWHDFGRAYEMGIQEDVDPRYDSELNLKLAIPQPSQRPDVLHWIQSRLVSDIREQYLTPADIFYVSSRLPEAEKRWDDRWDDIVPRSLTFKRFFRLVKREASAVDLIEAMHDCGMTPHFLETLPEAILVPLQDAISLCQPHPPSSWSDELLELVKRSDISLVLSPTKRPRQAASKILTPTHTASWDFKLLCQSLDESNSIGYDESEGTERQAVIRALFKDDRRLNEVQDLLSTHKSRVVRLSTHSGWTESQYLEKQKELVSRIATGTLAIPAGRGLLYYSLRYPLITQKFHIGGFNLNCMVKPANVVVGVDKSLFTEEKVCWGFFHQGVAAGLAISPQAKGIDTSWILYNKPGQELSNRHAGFLLALGLNGHLKDVAKWVAFKYLTPKHTMTSIGLLLGLAASYMGTMDSLITRLLSVHVTRMLPRGAAELNLSHLTQTSGIMGIGLLYYNSQHRRMSEIMLSEIEHVDGEDEEEPLRSESYRLAAGFALGLINLGKGNDLKGLHDLKVTEKLVTLATATKKVELVHVLDRAAAGAVMAIALIFMKSEDQIVARKIGVPTPILQFDYIRPDILLLRTVAKNLILWSKIEATFAWIQKNLPAAYRARFKLQGTSRLHSADLPLFSILAGLCLSVALRYSGSASTRVRDMLLHYLDQFIRISRIPPTNASVDSDFTPPYDEELARSYARMCQDVLALSASIVMSGTGDIPVFRRLRSLHGQDDPNTPYGSHLASHLAIGALFLGCGTAVFGSSNLSIAALLISFYPIFPNDVMDNRSHLQAFRHFWVLAVEQRCLVSKDFLTGQPISVPVHIKLRSASSESVLYRNTPCLLPPLDQIARVSTNCGPQYWDVDLDFTSNPIREAFTKTQNIYLRRRPPGEEVFSTTLHALGDDSKPDNPMEWLFDLERLKEISYAERASILEDGDQAAETGRAVDARLEMETCIKEGGDRERLEGVKLLFEWGGARERVLRPEKQVQDSQATFRPDAEGKEAEVGGWWIRDSVVESLKGKVMMAGREAEQ